MRYRAYFSAAKNQLKATIARKKSERGRRPPLLILAVYQNSGVGNLLFHFSLFALLLKIAHIEERMLVVGSRRSLIWVTVSKSLFVASYKRATVSESLSLLCKK